MADTFTHFRYFGRVSHVLAGLGLLLWVVSLFAPTLKGTSGFELAYVSLAGGAEYFFGGTWSALANFALPWASLRLMAGKPVTPLVVTMVAVVFSSPLFWSLLFDTTHEGWGVWAWTVAILTITAAWWAQRTGNNASAQVNQPQLR